MAVLPGGAPAGAVLSRSMVPGLSLDLSLGGGGALSGGGGELFQMTQGAGVRARSLVRATNPATGNDVWFKNVGKPILFSGELTACKRVNKIAARARRASPRRRTTTRRRR